MNDLRSNSQDAIERFEDQILEILNGTNFS